MAVTGFWPIKGSLKDLINYADNPEKTAEPEAAENDLQAAIGYVENGEKTERRLYIGGINCTRDRAYEEMITVQKYFGNKGKVIAYHGIQSFATGEVTPEEAFEIGKETVRAMWGDKYQVLVTVHLNTDNIHCHFVVNPVSFTDGSKYHNKIAEHKRLREVSDRICREHTKSVLENSCFYRGEKEAYWLHKQGRKTHRDQLKEDVEHCLSIAPNFRSFEHELKSMGYEIDPVRLSVRAPGWKRSVRLSNIGFSEEVILQRLEENIFAPDILLRWNERPSRNTNPLPLKKLTKQLEFSLDHAYDPATLFADTLFLLILTIFRITTEMADTVILTPELRHEMKAIKQHLSDYHLLQSEGIRTLTQLQLSIQETEERICELEHQRSKADNKRRRASTAEEKDSAKKERSEITSHIAPLRRKLKQEKQILEKAPQYYELLKNEYTLERKTRERSQSHTR